MQQEDQEKINLISELNLHKQQVEEYKSKYFQAQKEIENKNKEIEGLRQMMQMTQSIRGSDGRQSEDLRRNLQVLMSENQSLKQQNQELQNQLQQFNQQMQYQPQQQQQIQLQQEINRLNNDKMLIQGNLDILQQQFDAKTKDFDQLKVRLQAIDFIQNLPQGQEANKILVMGKEIQRLNSQLIQRDQELENLRSQLLEQQKGLQERDNLSAQLRSYEDKVRGLSTDIESMLIQVGGLKYDVQLKNDLERCKQQKLELERELVLWKDKHTKLENDSKHLYEIERKTEDLQNRLIRTNEENERLEQENRGIQLKLQAFDRLLKDKEQLERKIQDQESTIYNMEQQLNEKRREMEQLKIRNRDLEQDFINFKENIFRPNEERQKRLEIEIENWRNKCLALESNFFGNNERLYVENELKRLHGIVIQLQQENDELKSRPRRNQNNYGDEQRLKILFAEREKLYIELEEARRRIAQLERQPQIQQQQQQQPFQYFDVSDSDKDQQIQELKQGINLLIDENKQLKSEIDKQYLQIEQLEIDKNYIKTKQIAPKETVLEMLSKQPDLHKSVLEQLARRLYADLKAKDQIIEQMNQNLSVSQQLQYEKKIQDLEGQIQTLINNQKQQLSISQNNNLLLQQPEQQSLNNSRLSSPNKKKIFDQIDFEKIIEENQQLKNEIKELKQQRDYEFVDLLEQKDKELELIKLKFNQIQNNSHDLNVDDLKKLRDVLEQKAYEAQEWKDKMAALQMQVRNKENQNYNRPFSQNILEQEYKRLSQLYELKSLEVEDLKAKYGVNGQLIISENLQSQNLDVIKLKRILEMRTAELEEWKNKCLKLQQYQIQLQNQNQGNNGISDMEEHIRKLKLTHDYKTKEAEDWRQRYNQLLKNQDPKSGKAIDEMQTELIKLKRIHDAKHQELQEMQPRFQRMQQEKDVLENELRRLKYSLEQQITDNEMLKKKLGISTGGNMNNLSNDKIVREQQLKIQQLQQQLQQYQNQMNDFSQEHNKLKQTHQLKQDQIKSIALNIDTKEQQMRQLLEENQKLKSLLEQRTKDIEELKLQLQKASQMLQQTSREYQEYRKSTQSVESYKAQLAIMQNKVQESEKRVQQIQGDMQKLQNVLRDKASENEKLKENLNKVNQYQNEKNIVLQQLQQAKTTLQEKQKENEKFKQQYSTLLQQHQKLQTQQAETKSQLDKLRSVLGNFGK
ncbi:unnamed protein product [Paramecium pentaurelia]|uniref:Uncharacterized protein n=1 Tax=Paramecium pentaurelia TaxID=43138 RepID=A0A8S1W3J3_9CILI|nr:unnamed protein product [Paramecium pentaurelia]